MSLTSLDSYLASSRQNVDWFKTTARTTVAGIPFSLFDIAGVPGAGTLAVGNTANGIVPTPTNPAAGYPVLRTINGAGYVTRVEFGWTVSGRLMLYDRLFSAGAYAYNADTTLASQPSYSGRVPLADYSGLELWIEAVTAFTGTPSFEVNYLDQSGAAGDTGVVSAGAALILGRMYRMPLASGDVGLQQITRVRGTVATAGTFNVHIMRKLWEGRVLVANDGDIHDMLKTGAPLIYTTSALFVMIQPDSTASGLPDVTIEVADA
jgi:hypothetical protein